MSDQKFAIRGLAYGAAFWAVWWVGFVALCAVAR